MRLHMGLTRRPYVQYVRVHVHRSPVATAVIPEDWRLPLRCLYRCACMYVYVYACAYVYIRRLQLHCLCMCACMYVYACASACIHQLHIWIFGMHTDTHAHMCTYYVRQTQTYLKLRRHIRTYMHACIHTYIHMHISSTHEAHPKLGRHMRRYMQACMHAPMCTHLSTTKPTPSSASIYVHMIHIHMYTYLVNTPNLWNLSQAQLAPNCSNWREIR